MTGTDIDRALCERGYHYWNQYRVKRTLMPWTAKGPLQTEPKYPAGHETQWICNRCMATKVIPSAEKP